MQGGPVRSDVRDREFDNLLHAAHDFADRSGQTVLQYFRQQPPVDNKATGGAFDPVTQADRDAERIISDGLRDRFPDHGMVGEEFGTRKGAGRFDWVVDPIDGTRAFIMGSPLWGTLIGVLENGRPYLGLMNQPFTRERFWSGPDASYLRVGDGKPSVIKTRPCASLSDATLTTTHPNLFEGAFELAALAKLEGEVRMTRFGGDCYGYALLAAGFVDLIIESRLKPYDIVALIPIIERAGGRITTWDGAPATEGGNILASGDPKLHDIALKAIASA